MLVRSRIYRGSREIEGLGESSFVETGVFKGRGNRRILSSEVVELSGFVCKMLGPMGLKVRPTCIATSSSLLYGIERVLQHGRF